MEISSAIHSIRISNFFPFQIQSPSSFFFSNSSLSTKPYFPRPRHQWRRFTSTCALSDDTSSTVELATEPVNADPLLAVQKKATDVHADLKGTSIFLVGMNSVMKTSVGKAIADELRYYYFDSDSIVEEAAGKDSSGKSFSKRDQNGFRESETEVLKQLSSMGRLVVNAGNGAIQSATNLALLRHGISIWIDVPLDMVAKGFMGDEGQSTLSITSSADSFSEALGQLTKLYEENRAGYATADVTVSLQKVASKCCYDELEQVTTEDVALEVLKEIEKLTRVKKMMQEAGKPF